MQYVYIILYIFNESIYITLIQHFISKKITVFLCLLNPLKPVGAGTLHFA